MFILFVFACVCEKEEIRHTMQELKQKGQGNYIQSARHDDDSDDDDRKLDHVSEDIVDDSWKKQRYTTKQLHKKLDAVSQICIQLTSVSCV